MTALNIARDLDRIERDQENAGHSLGDPFDPDSQMPNNNNSKNLANPGKQGAQRNSHNKSPPSRKASNGGKSVAAKISVEPIVHVPSAANSSNVNLSKHESDAEPASSSTSSVNSERRGLVANKTPPSLVNETATSGEPVPSTSANLTGSGSGILGSGQAAHNSHGSPHSSTASNSGSLEAHVVRISNI